MGFKVSSIQKFNSRRRISTPSQPMTCIFAKLKKHVVDRFKVEDEISDFLIKGVTKVSIIFTENIKRETFTVLQLFQVLIQTPMIMDGLRRCSNSRHNKKKKPGRELVTFLIIANLIMYLWDTLEVKNTGIFKGPKKYYGENFWITISHMTLPLCIFYR